MKTKPQFFVMTVNTITDHFTTVNKNIITVNFMSVNTITVPWTAVNTTVPQSFDDSKYHLSPFDGCEYQHSPFYGLEYHISPLDDCECHLIPFCVCEYHLWLLLPEPGCYAQFTFSLSHGGRMKGCNPPRVGLRLTVCCVATTTISRHLCLVVGTIVSDHRRVKYYGDFSLYAPYHNIQLTKVVSS